MANETLSAIAEAIRKASEAYCDTLTSTAKALSDLVQHASGADRERVIEHWLRLARMSKDGVITALEQGFEMWERECRRMAASGASSTEKPRNPMEAWAENWRKATEAFTNMGSADWAQEARKQTEAVQKSLQEGLKAWQRLWEPEKKS
ncbi:MAG: hypothetical protein ACREQE_09445 [Candidatus Binataceae bacterium]